MDVVVVGAGVAGLCAARDLAADGAEVVVVDKGRAVGGRLASREVDGTRFDHGAQFLTTKDARFAALVDEAIAAGVVTEWFRGAPDADVPDASAQAGDDGHPRYRGVPHQRAFAQWLARDLDVYTATRLVDLAVLDDGRVAAHTEDGARLAATAAVVTCPVPQAEALLHAGRVELPAAARAALAGVTYDPCIALLVEPAGRTVPIGRNGAVRLGGEPFEWMADNRAKGIADYPSVTIHLGPATSAALLGRSDQRVAAQVLDLAADLLGASLRLVHRHDWRYSRPTNAPVDDLHVAVDAPPLRFAGDAFAGGRVEGAARSGWAAAASLRG